MANARMRNFAAQECSVEQSRQLDIIHEQRLPREQPAILIAFDRCTEIARRHGAETDLRDQAGESMGSLVQSSQKTSEKSAPQSSTVAFAVPDATYAYFSRRLNKHWARYRC
jgi:hypothetical protein